jgi:hypothetical protein
VMVSTSYKAQLILLLEKWKLKSLRLNKKINKK